MKRRQSRPLFLVALITVVLLIVPVAAPDAPAASIETTAGSEATQTPAIASGRCAATTGGGDLIDWTGVEGRWGGSGFCSGYPSGC